MTVNFPLLIAVTPQGSGGGATQPVVTSSSTRHSGWPEGKTICAEPPFPRASISRPRPKVFHIDTTETPAADNAKRIFAELGNRGFSPGQG